MTDVYEVLAQYGTQIPQNIGQAAYRCNSFPDTLAKLVPTDGSTIGDDTLAIYDIDGEDGVLVEHNSYDGDDHTRTYYTMQRDVVTAFIAGVVTKTRYIVQRGDEEYLPTFTIEVDEHEVIPSGGINIEGTVSVGSAENPI